MVDEAVYKKRLEEIFSKHPSYQQVGGVAYKEGLEGMVAFDKAMGHPHRSYPIVHIAGTNGKGSVSHMLASVLIKCGVKCGLYTSPHLLDFRERIKVNGEMVPKEFVLSFLERYNNFIESERSSFFEITTAMAFAYFKEVGVEIAVVETGLGGRLDSTNIVSPILSIITNIALDHCEQLGSTLPSIAYEKGGIIKNGVAVVIGESSETTDHLFERVAKERNAPLFFASKGLFATVELGDYRLDLEGSYQKYNLRTLLTALDVLSRNRTFKELVGEEWSDTTIREALSSVVATTGLRGRWEYLSRNPRVICDTGHNFNALSNLFSQLRREQFDRLFCIIGFVKDKELDKVLALLPHSAYFLFTQPQGERGLDSEVLARRSFALGVEGESFATVESALLRYGELYREGDLLFIGGSTFVVAEAMLFFENGRSFFAN
ncbi:MAG: Mur ligase family protein [Bacteroidales bacterium]